ncbi:MAG TPA: A/G-specific adenine glycosylase [Sphingomicrobium sp.]|jgi:A/G-specific adenine glycosylase
MPGEAAPDPYRVWLSEVMLQQTTVATVIPRFQRFLAKWPTVEALALASDEDVLSEWAGLGYYARARNLIACAREVVSHGGFPDTEDELRKLPGVGAYTAAAIAAIAFGRRALVMDTNVERVIARLNAIETPIADCKPRLRNLLDEITPNMRAGDFAQAMMDLGATICRLRSPNCPACPLSSDCKAFASGEPEQFPAPKRRAIRPTRYGVAHWIERNGHVWLVRRPAKGMLGGMAALPGPDWSDEPEPRIAPLGSVAQVFTHFRLELAIVASSEAIGDGWWQPVDRLVDAGLPTLYRRAVESVLGTRSALAA